MAQSIRPSRFVKPSILKQVDPQLLMQLLEPFSAALAARGVVIERGREPDFAALGRVLMHPDEDTPLDLIEALCLIHAVSDDDSYDRLRSDAQAAGIVVESDLPAPDLALRVYLSDRAIIERMHAERLSTKPRKFESFMTSVEPAPKIGLPADPAVQALQAGLGADFFDNHRGKGVRIFPFRTETGFRMLVRRGSTLKREVTIDADGETRSIVFRPEGYDVVRYNGQTGELSINAPVKRDVRAYCSMIGRHIFNDSLLFDADSPGRKFSLRPIIEKGPDCLQCEDCPGIVGVRLTSVSWEHDDDLDAGETLRSEDVFETLRRSGREIPRYARLAAAVFKITIRVGDGADHEVPLRIRPPNAAYYDREDHPELLEQWMFQQRFARSREEALRGVTARLLAVP